MSTCPSLVLSVPDNPTLSFYAATQIPGLSLPVTAFETLTGPGFISITSNGAVKASSFPIRTALGYVRVTHPSGTATYVQTNGLLNGFAGLTQGSDYFLGTGGQPTLTVPTSGIAQVIGTAASATMLLVHIEPPVTLA